MIVLEKATMQDGTKIQLEDWSDDYKFIPPASTLATYPKAKVSSDRQFGPRRNKTFRLEFCFESNEEARKAFENLSHGTKTLLDYKDNTDSELIDFIL